MRFRLLAAVFAACLAASAQTAMTVDQLFSFVESSLKFIKQGTSTDKELAGYLARCKLTEKLDDRTVEQLEGLGVGPKTREALLKLKDQSQNLGAAKPVEPAADPRLAPPPSSEDQAAILDEVRNYALNYSKRLPDFICTEYTRRFAAPRPGTRYGGATDSDPAYRLLDTLTLRLSYFEQKEQYKPILVNNTPTNQAYENIGGATTAGDFGSMMKEIFDRRTQARFEWDHWATLDSRPTLVFAYQVDQPRSQWHITVKDRGLDYVPGYRGLIYVDTETHEVTRITLQALGLPPEYPVKTATTILDYRPATISGNTYLLPQKARTEMAADEYLVRNDTEFRLYRKYQVESELKFDTEPAPQPLPESKEEPLTTPPPVKKK